MSPTSPSKAAVLLRRTRSERSSDLRRAHSAIGTSCCTPNDHRTIANTHAPDATRHPQCHRLRRARAVAHGRAVLYIILVRHETKTETARYSAPSDSSIPVMTSSVRAREPSAEARERDRETFHFVCSQLLLYTTALEHFRRARGHVAGVVSRRKTQEAKRPKTGAGGCTGRAPLGPRAAEGRDDPPRRPELVVAIAPAPPPLPLRPSSSGAGGKPSRGPESEERPSWALPMGPLS